MSVAVGVKYIQAVTVSATYVGAIMDAPYDRSLSLIMTHTSNLAGTWTLETSNDKATWLTEADATADFTNPSGSNAGTYGTDWTNVPNRYWRLRFTYVSGSGVVTVTAKQGDILQM